MNVAMAVVRPRIGGHSIASCWSRAMSSSSDRMAAAAPISRADMERERQARLKRSRESSIADTTPAVKRQGTELVRFANGTIALTPTLQSEAGAITIEDLLDRSHLKKAVLTSFCIDLEWLLTKLPPLDGDDPASLCIVKHWSAKGGDKVGVVPTRYPKLVFVHPPMTSSYGCMHSKLMVLVLKSSLSSCDYLRVVISSGNLVDYDYDGRMENVLFVQDFPQLSAGDSSACPEPGMTFKADLVSYLVDQGVPNSIISEVDKYDFRLAKARIVASKPGSHRIGSKPYGLASLSRAVCGIQASLSSEQRLTGGLSLECQSSSMGALNWPWLHQFYTSASGLTPTAATSQTHLPISVVFPSKETVKSSLLGEEGSGTIHFQPSNYNKSTFPKDILYDCVSRRLQGSLMHTKVIVARRKVPEKSDGTQPLGWMYIGSHNFTRAAWGYVTKTNSIVVNNWELGVIVPIEAPGAPAGSRLDGAPVKESDDARWDRAIFAHQSSIPFVRPPAKLDGKMPWMKSTFF